MKLSVEEARRLSEEVLTKAGLTPQSAQIVTDVLIEAELRGRKGHGLIRLPGLVQHAGRSRGEPTVLKEGGQWASLDGGGEIGYVVAYQATTLAIAKAKKYGTGVVAVRNATHCGMLGYYVLMAAKANMIGLMTCNCSPRVAPFGGTTSVFGTNPIAIAIPAPEEPILVDMATSSATTGDLLVAAHKGEQLSDGLAYDAQGNPTTDPNEALDGALAAFGGHKGAALALVSQILSGVLTGAAPLPKPGTDYGYLIAVIDPGVFTPIDQFRTGVGEVIAAMKNAKLAEGAAEILFPGERSHRSYKKALISGIEIDPQLLARIRNIQR